MQLIVDRCGQVGEREGFGQEDRIRNFRLFLTEVILRIARDKNNPHIRALFKRLAHPAWPIHAGHNDVCYEDIDIQLFIFEHLQRGFGGFGFEHRVAAEP